MTTASELIPNALRHINVPGRGASLSPADTNAAFGTLQRLLRSSAVTSQKVPGVRRHFFALTTGQTVYKYGKTAAADLRSDDFGDSPPVKIEDAYIRQGGSITNNEQVDEYKFQATGTWMFTGTAAIIDNQLVLADIGVAEQAIALTVGVTYDITVDLTVNAGTADVIIDDGGSPAFSRTLDASGSYTFEYTHSSATADALQLETDVSTDDITITQVSILQQHIDRLVLTAGTDRTLHEWTQKGYNRLSQKNSSARPTRYLYERNAPLPQLRFDHAPTAGDIVVLDVLVDRITPDNITDELALNDDAEMWLEWELCYLLAGDYGKTLSRDQLTILQGARSRMRAGNQRRNRLQADIALTTRRQGGTYDINSGE